VIRKLLRLYRRGTIIKDSSERERVKHDIMGNYGQLNILSAFTDEERICDFMEECSIGHLYRLLTLILYFQEIEKRYVNKVSIKPALE
ncbi:unnamed protein product, partial [marine sediment metagenome]